jgi:hypothetical protein
VTAGRSKPAGGWPTRTGDHPPAASTVRGNRDFRLLWVAQALAGGLLLDRTGDP